MKWKGFRDINATVIINLEGVQAGDLFMKIDRSRRKNINIAKSFGLVFKEADEEDWKVYYQIVKKIWSEGGSKLCSLEELRRREREENHKLFVVKKDNKVLGGGLIKIFPEKIRFEIFGSLLEFQDKRVNDFLYWNCILWALKNKKKYVDLGGWQINAREHLRGVNKFKEQWGEKHFYYVYSYNPFYILGRKLIRNSNFLYRLNKKLRGRK